MISIHFLPVCQWLGREVSIFINLETDRSFPYGGRFNTVHYIQRQIHVTIEYPECSLETSLGVHFINVNCAFIHLEKQKKNQVRRMARKCMKPGKSSGIRRHSEVVDPGKDASELQSEM